MSGRESGSVAERKPLKVGKTGSSHGTFASAAGPRASPPPEGAVEKEKEYTLSGQFTSVFTSNWQLKLLLVCVPVAIGGGSFHVSDGILFFASFFGLIPLAALLGDFTEDIALRSNDVIGALINVTFGNATELIISIMALRAGMYDLIKLSLIGSILGNMLLVLGTAFIVGGIKNKVMNFNGAAANTFAPLLLLSVLSFVIPSGFGSQLADTKVDAVALLSVSRQIAAVAVFVYVGYIIFQLYTHKSLFDAIEETETATVATEDEEEEEEGPTYTLVFAVVGLAVASIILSLLSDILVGSLQGAAKSWGMPAQFIGIILVPIVGNAAEHASAVIMASKNKLDISIGVAIGSSIQISLFVMPLLVLIAWGFNIPLDMNFHPFPTALLFVSVLVTTNVTTDGSSNWLEGLMLIAAYIMIAMTFLNGSFNMS